MYKDPIICYPELVEGCSINYISYMKKGWVYILKCSDNSFYTGSTSNLEKRIYEHKNKIHTGFTAERLPVTLVFSEEFPSIEEAIRAERQIKGWTRRKKEALISGDFDLLVELSNHNKKK